MRATLPVAAMLAAALYAAGPSPAGAVTFDIGWTGNQAALEGQLTFDDSLLGTGIIDGTQIDRWSSRSSRPASRSEGRRSRAPIRI